MLTKKFYSSVGEGVVTADKLKQLKNDFTDGFNLDFNELLRVFLKNEGGNKTACNFMKEMKPKPIPESEATKKRKRMMSYADGVAKRDKKPV